MNKTYSVLRINNWEDVQSVYSYYCYSLISHINIQVRELNTHILNRLMSLL